MRNMRVVTWLVLIQYLIWSLQQFALAPLEAAEAIGICVLRLMAEAGHRSKTYHCYCQRKCEQNDAAFGRSTVRGLLQRRAELEWILLVQAVHHPGSGMRVTARTST